MSYQKTIIVGNVGKEPEMRYIPSGTAVTSFSVAVNTKHGEEKITLWYRVTAWGKLAETCQQYVSKGMTVVVEGELTADKDTGAPRIWTKKDGSPATSFEINASTVRFLSGGKGKQEQNQEADTDKEFPF